MGLLFATYRLALLQSLAIDSDFFMPMLKFVRWFGINPDFSRATVNDTLPINVCNTHAKCNQVWRSAHYDDH